MTSAHLFRLPVNDNSDVVMLHAIGFCEIRSQLFFIATLFGDAVVRHSAMVGTYEKVPGWLAVLIKLNPAWG